MSNGREELVLPDHVARQRREDALPIPACVDCKQPLAVGDTISSVVVAVGPGVLQMAPVHLKCVLKVDEEAPDGEAEG